MVDMIGEPDGPNLERSVLPWQGRKRSFQELGPERDRRAREEENKQIDTLICPPDPSGKILRAGVSKRGEWRYYRLESGTDQEGNWVPDRSFTRGELIKLRLWAMKDRISSRHRTGGCELFYQH